MSEVKPKYRCYECQCPGQTCRDHCTNCGRIKSGSWKKGYSEYCCDTCGADVTDLRCGDIDAREPDEPDDAAKLSARHANEDIFGPMPVDSGAWICWLLIGMLMGLLAGGVLAVWYLK